MRSIWFRIGFRVRKITVGFGSGSGPICRRVRIRLRDKVRGDEHLQRHDAETVVKNIDAALDDKRRLSQQEMSFCLHSVSVYSTVTV